VEQAHGVLVATLAAPDEAKVCDHLSLELLVSQLPEEIERLLEVLNRHWDAAVGMNEREGEVVERQCLGAPVAQVAHYRKRGAMLHDSSFVIAITAKLRAELVESMRPAAAVVYGRLWLPLVIFQEAMGPPRCTARVAPKTSPQAQLVEPGFSSAGGSLDRGGACSKRTFHSVAALEPERAGDNASDEQERDGGKQQDAESESRQEPGQQEPDPRECEDATAELLAIG
jgi:hypothetical protein